MVSIDGSHFGFFSVTSFFLGMYWDISLFKKHEEILVIRRILEATTFHDQKKEFSVCSVFLLVYVSICMY